MTSDAADSSSGGRLVRALGSLRGLSVGDALGARFALPANYPLLERRELPPGPWRWTDDTEMACSVVAVLAAHHRVDQDALARSFARRHDSARGYGPAVDRLLGRVREGGDWSALAAGLFNGQGSWGNGAAMRIAPLGAWYADDPEQATHQAEISAYPTHQHREAVVGAMAVAAAAALAADPAGPPGAHGLLDGVIALVPGRSAVGAGLRRARDMLDYGDAVTVAAVLGCGRRTTAHDTVPFALWSAARSLGDYEEAFWTTAGVGGDVDTTCAIVGGVLAAGRAGAPPDLWTERTEALPDWPAASARTD
ncbi:ADP-ribosylglycohydrolase family protein [Streptomyces sp. SID8352]|uniref:ADP-ribosylglycohydrolase family protein n=1 Tax=Streptomyces sp. SID8352 TaxID=2690338 RepID=UPI001372279D|nr:ADP-ribosylglycohydrolase family protein [Streptomyces sp. SID8352]MYU24994.1 ADP-ribosylglycohydrolase family protein [Streptomyces sp. SID8352]